MRLKNQKGAISVFVLLAMLFFLVFIMSAYAVTARKVQTQTLSLSQLQYYYRKDADTIAATKYASSSNIPIYNYEQLKLAGTNNYAVVDNKVYLFKSDATYQLKSNIVIDFDDYFSRSVVDDMVFVDWKLDTASGETSYNIKSNGYNIYYYKDGAYWKLVNYQNENLGDYNFSTSHYTTSIKQEARYSVMSTITGYKYHDANNDGTADTYEFLLIYNLGKYVNSEFNKDAFMRWKQEQSPNDNRQGTTATGFQNIENCPTGNTGFYGLLRSTDNNYLYSGNTSNKFTVGVTKRQTPPIAINGNYSKAYLFARVDMK